MNTTHDLIKDWQGPKTTIEERPAAVTDAEVRQIIKDYGIVGTQKMAEAKMRTVLEAALSARPAALSSVVYVVMGNDFPVAVFDNEDTADNFVAQKMIDQRNEYQKQHPDAGETKVKLFATRIYYRHYKFEVLKNDDHPQRT